VALVRTDVSEELNASIISVARIGELGVTTQKTPFFCKSMFKNVFYCDLRF
jgi:hypothetical protein